MKVNPALPYFTGELPGTGGALRCQLEDFAVEEVPAYVPTGQGDHVFAWIEKRGETTLAAMRGLAGAVGAQLRDVGSAGLKDRHAVTRQMLSFPPPVTPEALLAANVPGVRVLAATRHPHKLRTGHLRGNRFALVIRRLAVPAGEAAARAGAVLDALARPPGSPNWFGEQRFGAAGDNAAAGRALLREAAGGGKSGSKPQGEGGGWRGRGRGGRLGGRERRLMISAYQAELFNRFLRLRIEDGVYRTVLAGDLLHKAGGGGLFDSTEPTVDQARLERGELVVTGPMFGHAMRAPAEGSAAAAREAAILAEEELSPGDFRPLGKLAPGTRRALSIALEDVAVDVIEPDAIRIQLTLPSGAYATAVLREVLKVEGHDPGDDGSSPRDDQGQGDA